MNCNLYKVQLKVLEGTEEHSQVFWGYQFNEAKARDAAITWAEKNYPTGKTTITSVDIVK